MRQRTSLLLGALALITSLLACRLLPAEPTTNPELASAQTQLAAQARTRLASMLDTQTPMLQTTETPAEGTTIVPVLTGTPDAVTPSATNAGGAGGPVALTPTHTRTTTATTARTRTPTTAAQAGLEGEWTVCMEQDDGTYSCGPLSISVEGTTLTATGTLGEVQYSFDGIVIQDGAAATGAWTNPSQNGYYWLSLLPKGYFSGSRDNAYGFCGNRGGADMPDPCMVLPPS